MYKSTELFLSTPSARRATSRFLRTWQRACISIHALREEGDTEARPNHRPASNFYPRPPRGGRLGAQSVVGIGFGISIHALREEGDTAPQPVVTFVNYFYPRPPRGGRLLVAAVGFQCHIISIHALREEGDFYFVLDVIVQIISIHALREEGDLSSKPWIR